MRTKALLLAAAFAAAGVATSMAQVYSVNAVGYVNKDIGPGFTMVANPLTAADNTVGVLFKNFQQPIPQSLKVFAFKSGAFVTAQYDAELDNKYIPDSAAAQTIPPGEGVFIYNPSASTLTLTFVGEVPQGTALANPLPKGFSIRGNIVPQAVAPDSVGFPGGPGDKVFRYNRVTKGYDTYLFDDIDNVWKKGTTVGLPAFDVGEAFWVFRSTSAATWTRSFSVN